MNTYNVIIVIDYHQINITSHTSIIIPMYLTSYTPITLSLTVLTVRIGRDTAAEGFGYFEDRRPASNVVRTSTRTYT